MELDGHLLHLGLQLVCVGLLQGVTGRPSVAVPAGDGVGHLPLGSKQPVERRTDAEVSCTRPRCGPDGGGSYVMPTSLRSFSVSVRNIRRSMSCSSSSGRYLEKPICSRNAARSWGHSTARAQRLGPPTQRPRSTPETCLGPGVGRGAPATPRRGRGRAVAVAVATLALGVVALGGAPGAGPLGSVGVLKE